MFVVVLWVVARALVQHYSDILSGCWCVTMWFLYGVQGA